MLNNYSVLLDIFHSRRTTAKCIIHLMLSESRPFCVVQESLREQAKSTHQKEIACLKTLRRCSG